MDNNSMNLHNIADGIAESIEDDCKIKRVRESALLLKRKMCKTHDLIKQYSENMKEIDYLKSSLENAKKEGKHTISNYKFAMDKIRELELKIVEDKQRNEKLINKINEYEINVAADKQIIQQLTCKIKDLEDERSTKNMEYNLQKSYFEDKIKDLEHELKKSKIMSTHKKKEKKMLSLDLITKPNIGKKSSSDIGINVSLCDNKLSTKEVQDKNIMTDQFYNMKDDPHPLFCAKCEAHLPPDLTPEKICKTMSAYPKLIERDLSPPLSPPKKTYSPPCSLPSMHPESMNRNEDALSRISVPHFSPYSPHSDSVVSNLKSQSGRSSAMAQNGELRNMDISPVPVIANLSDNLDSIPAVFTLPQNRNYAREDDFCSDNLLTKHSSSIKEMERKIRSLESKMKKFRRLKKKLNNSCRRNINYKDDMSLNSNLISVICKSVMEYYDEKQEICFKNKQGIDSENCTCCTKKKQLLNKSNTCKNTFSCKTENGEQYQVCNKFCDKTENAAKAIDTLPCERTLSVHNTLLSDINTSIHLLTIDKSDKREVDLHEKGTLHSAEIVSIEDDLTTSHLSADKICTNDNLLDKDNIEAIDADKIETEMVLSNDENSTDHLDDKITDINAEKNEIKNKSQNVHEDKVDKICASNNLLSKDSVEAIDVDNKIETEIVLSNDEEFTDHADGKITDSNSEKNEINKSQNVHEDKVDKICASNNLLSKDSVEAIYVDNKTEIEIVLSNDKNFIDHADGKIIDIYAEENEVKNKNQNVHEDKVDELCTSDNLLSKDVKTINEIETGIFVSNDEHSTDHTDGKIDDINAEKSIITNMAQNIHTDKVDEIYTSDNLLNNKNNVEAIDMNQTKMTFLFNDENSTDHVDNKIIEINTEKNVITSETQNIHIDKGDEISASNNLLNKNNVEVVDMDNQIETETTFLSNDKNSTDRKIIHIAETNEIKSKGQNIHKDENGKLYTNDNLLSKNNIEAIDMDNKTKGGRESLLKNKNSIDHASNIIDIKESKIKRKGENIRKNKVGDRLLKKLRNLKRKTQAKSRVKQENIESYSDHSSEHNELSKKSRIENMEESSDSSLKSNINLKRKLNTRVESVNKLKDNKLCSDDYEPVKKLRIAHTPKTSVPELNTKKNDFTHSTIRNIASLVIRRSNINQQSGTCTRKNNLLIENKINEKCVEKNIKSIETNNIKIIRRPMNEKDLDLTSAEDCLQNNDIALPAVNIERVSEKCNDVLFADTINRKISMDRVMAKVSSNGEPDTSRKNIANNTANDLKLREFSPLRTNCIITQSKSSILHKDSRCDRLTEALETIETRQNIMPTAELEHEALGSKDHDYYQKSKDAILNGDRSNVSKATRNLSSNNNSDVFDGITEILRSPLPRDSSTIVEDCTNDNNMKESLNKIKNAGKREEMCANNETFRVQPVKTRRKNLCVNQQDKGMKFIDVPLFSEVEDESQTPISRLNKYINQQRIKKCKLPRKQISYVSKITDKFVKKQLQRLINSAWEETILDDIIDKLKNTCGPRIIAKCIVEFLLEDVDHYEALDKSFTPPAPLMTTFEQKIITLLTDLEVLKPTVIYFVQAAIEYNLFRLNSNVKTQVDSLTRIYVVLSLIQKDRERIRMMCCDAFYCMGLKSIDILYTVLTCWSEVLPNAKANKEILPKCIAFLIGSYQIEDGFVDVTRSMKKLYTLKSLVLRFHEYTYTLELKSDIVTELMTAFKAERINGLDTAIIIVAKREGPSWTYKNIIQSVLLPMIKNEHPCGYNVFSLLGRLLRAFPLKDEDNIVKNISEYLCDLIESGQGSHEQQEGIISALLSLSRQKFDIVAPFVIKWVPSKPLRPIINTQLQAFINLHNSKFWKKYLELLKIKYNDNSG